MSLFWGRTKFCWYQITSVCEWIYVWHMLFFDWQKSDLFHFLCEETSQMVHYVCHMAKSSPPVHHKDLKFNTGNLVGSSTCLCVKPHLGWHTFWTSISQVVYGCMVCVFVNALLLCNLITLHISEARNAPHPSRIKTHTHTHIKVRVRHEVGIEDAVFCSWAPVTNILNALCRLVLGDVLHSGLRAPSYICQENNGRFRPLDLDVIFLTPLAACWASYCV